MITVQRSGEPGSDMANMYIRGISTFGSNQSPLILVDGVDRDIRMMDVQRLNQSVFERCFSYSCVWCTWC